MLRLVQGSSNTVLKQRVSNNFVQQASRNYLHTTQPPTTTFIQPQSSTINNTQRHYTSTTAGSSTNHSSNNSNSNSSSSIGGTHPNGKQQPSTDNYNTQPTTSSTNNSRNNNNNNNNRRRFNKNDDRNQKFKPNHVNKHLNFTKIEYDSPHFEQFKQFDSFITQSLQISAQQTSSLDYKGRTKQSFQFQKNPLYWDSVTNSMRLYREINKSADFSPERLSSLIHLLHNGLRINRFQLARMSKKPDYDSSSFHKQITNFIYESLKEISDDVLYKKLEITEFGLMHLITCFKELLLEEEAVEIWNKGLQRINDPNMTDEEILKIKSVYLNSKVVGTVLPLLCDQGLPFEESYKLYKESMALSSPTQYSNLILGMLLVCLKMGANKKALDLFSDLFSIAHKNYFGYLIEAHLAFIGECKDLNVANDFFQRAISGEMPYKVDLQVSFVKKFMDNTWAATKDFQQVYDIWLQASKFYGSYVHHGISSSLNDQFFNIFFEAFNIENSEEGFVKLQQIITTYNSIKQIDEPFFNIILSKACSTWKNYKILEFIDQSYAIYNTNKTIIAYRILLKSLGSIDQISNFDIMKKWNELLNKSDETGSTYIANADWAALRDSTLTWAMEKSNILKLAKQEQELLLQQKQQQSLTPPMTPPMSPSSTENTLGNASGGELAEESHEYNPAVQALKNCGAFENESSDELNNKMNDMSISQTSETHPYSDEAIANLEKKIHERIDTYWSIFFQYSNFCRDLNQLKKLSNGYTKKFSSLEPYLTDSKKIYESQPSTIKSFINLKSFNDY